jgi:succinate dehydrogenase (ubiquinone) flavoprotein subunit
MYGEERSEIRPSADVICVDQNDAAVFRTQDSLEHGVKELSRVLGTWKDVGIKDRSMIWNSYVASFPRRRAFQLTSIRPAVTSSRRSSSGIC